MLHVHVTLFNISNEKIEPLSFCVIYPVGKKGNESINLFDLSEFDITMKFQTGLLKICYQEAQINLTCYIYSLISLIVHVKKMYSYMYYYRYIYYLLF